MPNTAPLNQDPPGSWSDRIDFESALVRTLKADGDLTALIAGRVYPLAIPEKRPGATAGYLPCLVYAITATDRARNLSGFAGVAIASVLIDCRAKTYAEVNALREILRQYDGFDGWWGSVEIMNVVFSDQADEFEWPGGGSGAGTFHLTVSWRVKYREPIPARYT
jgi:hypothetical protein